MLSMIKRELTHSVTKAGAMLPAAFKNIHKKRLDYSRVRKEHPCLRQRIVVMATQLKPRAIRNAIRKL